MMNFGEGWPASWKFTVKTRIGKRGWVMLSLTMRIRDSAMPRYATKKQGILSKAIQMSWTLTYCMQQFVFAFSCYSQPIMTGIVVIFCILSKVFIYQGVIYGR